MTLLDPDRLQAAVNGALGGVVYGLYLFAAQVLAGQPVSRQQAILLAANIACAIVAGAILAYGLTAMAVAWAPWLAAKDATALGMGIGIFGWELLPLGIELARRRAKALGKGRGR